MTDMTQGSCWDFLPALDILCSMKKKKKNFFNSLHLCSSLTLGAGKVTSNIFQYCKAVWKVFVVRIPRSESNHMTQLVPFLACCCVCASAHISFSSIFLHACNAVPSSTLCFLWTLVKPKLKCSSPISWCLDQGCRNMGSDHYNAVVKRIWNIDV